MPLTLIALTITVIIPRGPMARSTSSAQPILMLRNCLVTCSPKRVRRGARSEKRLLENSSPANPSPVGNGMLELVVVVGAMAHSRR
jgi:hypothetical protein